MSPAVTRFRFGAGQIDAACLLSGWGFPEEKITWTVGTKSVLRLTYEPAAGDLQLEFSLWPFFAEPHPESQRLEVSVNGRRLGSERIAGRTVLGFQLARGEFEPTGVLYIQLRCPDATAPSSVREDHDNRQLGFAIEEITIRHVPAKPAFRPRQRAPLPITRFTGTETDRELVRNRTALSPAELAMFFESLGTNCEFGLFQRRCGVEPLGLLRFAGMDYPDLVAGLDAGFSGIEDIDNLTCFLQGAHPEWMIRSKRFGMVYHTFHLEKETSSEELLRRQSSVLSFRRAKLLDILGTGEKLFVVTRPDSLTHAQALPLIAALRDYGPNALLFIDDRSGQPSGTVTALDRDLFCGSMDGVEGSPSKGLRKATTIGSALPR